MSESSEPTQVGTADELLNQRYGRDKDRRFDKRFGWIAAGVLVLSGLALLVASGWQQTSSIEAKVLTNSVVDDRTVTIDMQITAPVGAVSFCALEALSESHAVVGWKIVELAPSDQHTRRTHETIVTTAPATTGSVRTCWTPSA